MRECNPALPEIALAPSYAPVVVPVLPAEAGVLLTVEAVGAWSHDDRVLHSNSVAHVPRKLEVKPNNLIVVTKGRVRRPTGLDLQHPCRLELFGAKLRET